MNLRFAYWIPSINSKLAISKNFSSANWSNTQLAQTAEVAGFEYALSETQSVDKYGTDCQLEALTTAVALAKYTKGLNTIASVHPGLWHPGMVAKMATTIDFATNGRFCLNVVTGGFSPEFLNQRYNRCEEFIRVIKGMWTQYGSAKGERGKGKGVKIRLTDKKILPFFAYPNRIGCGQRINFNLMVISTNICQDFVTSLLFKGSKSLNVKYSKLLILRL
jgi:alkanesulfonate monooxygenase SsuD/methylene tetrahydromethanopterin reductase-like flavin-dependent oxidoreductase (luciferase family)